MLSNYIEQLFKLDNYYDGLIVTDNKGYIEFFMTYRPDISGAKQEDLVGKHVLDIYPGLTEETSTIMRVLRSGEPIYNEYQTLITCREEVFQSVNTTMPIRAGGTGEIKIRESFLRKAKHQSSLCSHEKGAFLLR